MYHVIITLSSHWHSNGHWAIVLLSLSITCLTKFLHFLSVHVPWKVNFGGAPLLFVVKPTAAGATAIREKCKKRGQFLDPDSKGKCGEYNIYYNIKLQCMDVLSPPSSCVWNIYLTVLNRMRVFDCLAWSNYEKVVNQSGDQYRYWSVLCCWRWLKLH